MKKKWLNLCRSSVVNGFETNDIVCVNFNNWFSLVQLRMNPAWNEIWRPYRVEATISDIPWSSFFLSFRLLPSRVATADFPTAFGPMLCILFRHFNHSHVLSHRIHKPYSQHPLPLQFDTKHPAPIIPIIFPPYMYIMSKRTQSCLSCLLCKPSHPASPSAVIISDGMHSCHSYTRFPSREAPWRTSQWAVIQQVCQYNCLAVFR